MYNERANKQTKQGFNADHFYEEREEIIHLLKNILNKNEWDFLLKKNNKK